MVESNRSASPCREQMLISETHSESLSAKVVSAFFSRFGTVFSSEAIRKAALLNLGAHLLHRTVCVQEFAGKIDDFFPVPMHDHAPGIRNAGNNGCSGCFRRLQVQGIFRSPPPQQQPPCVPEIRLSQAPCRQARHIFRNPVKLDIQSVRKLADCNGNAARTEIVAAFYQC